MDPPRARDLGSGVLVSTLADGTLMVRSGVLVLPWSPRSGRVAGTAILLEDRPYEVVARSRVGGDDAWTLRSWPENEAMRTVFRLDEAATARLAQDAAGQRRASRLRVGLLPVAPVLGFAPASLQSAWEAAWGFPAVVASSLSALAELAVAAVGILHVLSISFGGPPILPRWIAWIGLLAPAIAVEAVVRLKHVVSVGEPIGSAALLPLAGLASKEVVAPPSVNPEVRVVDPALGRLRVCSPIHRSDWVPGGVMLYRESPYELESVGREGRHWVYTFGPARAGEPTPTLRLQPPRNRVPALQRAPAPSLARAAVGTALACLAPRDLQEAWGRRIGAPPVLLTVLGAGAELSGALINLAAASTAGSRLSLLVNLFLLAEGAGRFVMLAVRGGPVGSLLGLAVRPVLERWIRQI